MINLVCEDFAKWVINNWPPLLPAAVIRLFPRSHPHIGCGCCDSSIWTAAWREVNNMSANITCSGQCQGGGALDVTLVSRMSEHEIELSQTKDRLWTRKTRLETNKFSLLFMYLLFVLKCWFLYVLWRNLKLLSCGNLSPGSLLRDSGSDSGAGTREWCSGLRQTPAPTLRESQ